MPQRRFDGNASYWTLDIEVKKEMCEAYLLMGVPLSRRVKDDLASTIFRTEVDAELNRPCHRVWIGGALQRIHRYRTECTEVRALRDDSSISRQCAGSIFVFLDTWRSYFRSL